MRSCKSIIIIMLCLTFIVIISQVLFNSAAGIRRKRYSSAKKISKPLLPSRQVETNIGSMKQRMYTHKTVGNFSKSLYLEMAGRFGNAIFQFVGLYGLARSSGCDKMYFKDAGQINRLIQFFPNLAIHINVVSNIPPNLRVVKEPEGCIYSKETELAIASAGSDVLVKGYLGVPLYWWPRYESQIKHLLQVSEQLQEITRNYLFKIASKQKVDLELRRNNLQAGTAPVLEEGHPYLVGVQVRRGDKAEHPEAGWRVATETYFKNAMAYFKKKYNKVYFVIVSEDKIWAKTNIIGNNVIHSTSEDDLLELALLALCDHTIMSIGSFSWWAGYLAGGEVVYFRSHVTPRTLAAKYYNDTQHFLPHWKPLD